MHCVGRILHIYTTTCSRSPWRCYVFWVHFIFIFTHLPWIHFWATSCDFWFWKHVHLQITPQSSLQVSITKTFVPSFLELIIDRVLGGVRASVILLSKLVQYFRGTPSHLTNLLIFQDLVLSLWTYAALQVKPKLTPTTIIEDEQESNYLEIGSGIATMRLLKDLKAIWKKKPEELVAF